MPLQISKEQELVIVGSERQMNLLLDSLARINKELPSIMLVHLLHQRVIDARPAHELQGLFG